MEDQFKLEGTSKLLLLTIKKKAPCKGCGGEGHGMAAITNDFMQVAQILVQYGLDLDHAQVIPHAETGETASMVFENDEYSAIVRDGEIEELAEIVGIDPQMAKDHLAAQQSGGGDE